MSEGISYKDAGVDIDAADEIVRSIAGIIAETWGDEAGEEIGGFAGRYRPPWDRYCQPELVACTDSVGTKMRLASLVKDYSSVGADCAAMVLNDLIIERARPLFFIDYIAADTLQHDEVVQIVEGLAQACSEAGCALIGGETAEMPGFYQPGDYELVGFGVGIAEGSPEESARPPAEGDVLVALGSSGVHSNGFSLVRHLIDLHNWNLDKTPADLDAPLAEVLMRPTRIYVKALEQLFAEADALTAAHITGGGIPGNVPRVLPDGLTADIDWGSWETPAIFDFIREAGGVAEAEMRRTFNMGVGMVVIVREENVDDALKISDERGIESWAMGTVRESQ